MEDMREKAVPECAGTADAAVFYESVLLAMEKFEPPTDATAAIIWTGYYNLLKSQACQSAAELMLVLSPAALFVCNTGK